MFFAIAFRPVPSAWALAAAAAPSTALGVDIWIECDGSGEMDSVDFGNYVKV